MSTGGSPSVRGPSITIRDPNDGDQIPRTQPTFSADGVVSPRNATVRLTYQNQNPTIQASQGRWQFTFQTGTNTGTFDVVATSSAGGSHTVSITVT